jgi:hypothetical protein
MAASSASRHGRPALRGRGRPCRQRLNVQTTATQCKRIAARGRSGTAFFQQDRIDPSLRALEFHGQSNKTRDLALGDRHDLVRGAIRRASRNHLCKPLNRRGFWLDFSPRRGGAHRRPRGQFSRSRLGREFRQGAAACRRPSMAVPLAGTT